MATVLTAVVGYLLGSIPIAGILGRRAGRDLRDEGDRNPGYWNARTVLGRRASLVVFVGDVAKGAAAAGFGRAIGETWWVGYVGGAAAMVGHAWPVFAGFRGGRSILCFVGAVLVLAPVPAVIAVALCTAVSLASRRFEFGARAGVFGFPLIQAWFDPRAQVAATGAMMSIIGIRFAQAALAERRAQRGGA